MVIVHSWQLKQILCECISEATGEDENSYDEIKFKELATDLGVDSFMFEELLLLLEEKLDCHIETGYLNSCMSVEQVLELLKVIVPNYVEYE